jgi:aspartate/methionine/tyrosine aminotransferase
LIAKRAQHISPFIVMDVLEKACELECRGTDIVHLEVGEPDFDIPEAVKQAAHKALEDGETHYTHSLGMPELREAICEYYHDTYAVTVDPDQVLVTSGSSPAILLAFATLCDPGDQVIIADPHYACYPNFIKFVQGEIVTVPVVEADGFQLEPETMAEKISGRTRAILINSPSNPTGNLLSAHRMEAIADLTPTVVSDEIYHGLVYEGAAHSMLEFSDQAFVISGFSKLYAMTGLRLGYLIAPKPFIRTLQKLHQNFFISANAISQKAGIAALRETAGDVQAMKATYNRRRQFMIQRLRELGFGITVAPTGAFYVFANAKHLSNNSYDLAFDILQHAGVGVAPGIDFGQNGEGYLRFSYANSMQNIAEGMNRIEAYLRNLQPEPPSLTS